ncbi:LytTR family DNA-binding domain-containing protein [Curvibacter sp. APW13]|uniref:LytR/AlgR family response regulator transcription factor n=1 Tax=Curvibacter sp. APW13 TaxID=3077236 RepID=UPI0028DE9570|nr:LytTR family DNA-binding domain-containing protein [Curvibacter sp. APW13]MDT8992016.1 LytTR family DNA-binding domain-containing protein [Curvibacter sp. APW13]
MSTALIAEDEPLLAASLQAELARLWPDLRIVASVGDGASAVEQALALQPEVLFFDVRMPALSGLEAAAELADRWDTAARPFPALVFVTAYDQYAVAAFEAQALDYVLKPVQTARLRKTVEKLQAALAHRAPASADFDATLAKLRSMLAPAAAPPVARSTLLQASVGNQIHMVPVAEVLYFEAADKYVRVLTAEREYLLRTPLKDLMAQLDPEQFWQVHRGTLVRATAIDRVVRDESGKLRLYLRQRAETLVVSRLYAHLFKAL